MTGPRLFARSVGAVALALLLAPPPAAAQEDRPGRAPSPPWQQVPEGWIGFSYAVYGPDGRERSLFTGPPPENGTVVIRSVRDGSPAARSGLAPGDTLVRINGERATPISFFRFARELDPGDRVRLTLRREGRSRDVLVVAGRRPEPARGTFTFLRADSIRKVILRSLDSVRITLREAEVTTPSVPDSVLVAPGSGGRGRIRIDAPRVLILEEEADSARREELRRIHARLEMLIEAREERSAARPPDPDEPITAVQVSPLAPFMTGRFVVAGARLIEVNPGLGAYFGTDSGLLVTRLYAGTPAARADLRPGDVIVGVGEDEVESRAELRRRLAAAERPASLRVVRKGEMIRVTLPD